MSEFTQTGNEPVLFEMAGPHIAVATLNRPDKRNAVNGAVTQAFSRIARHVEETPEIFVAILTSCDDKVFCAGADLGAVASGDAAGLMTDDGGFAGFTDLARLKPWIASVEGAALAGGCEIAIACDMIVASENARFGVPEVKRSLIAGGGGVYRLPKLIPRNIALELIATGDPIDAARAYQIGLVNQIVPGGGAREGALALAERIACNAPLAVQQSLKVARAALSLDETAGREAARRGFDVVGPSEDLQEGPRAFLEKRPPVWKGR